MPRQVGQIDLRKSEGILDAAAEAFSERGLEAPMEDIARRAGVSKQTIYNHYGSKDDLLRALFDRRRETVVEPLSPAHEGEALEDRLTTYLENIIDAYSAPTYATFVRSAIAATMTKPDFARMMYDAGPKIGRARLADFLQREAAAGRLDIDDADEASDFLFGMAAGALIQRVVMDAKLERGPSVTARRARSCARRFIRAYAPHGR